MNNIWRNGMMGLVVGDHQHRSSASENWQHGVPHRIYENK